MMMPEEEDSSLETEIEALKSIYIHELEVHYSDQNKPDFIKVQLYPATADNVTEQYVKLLLVLKLHSQYPHCLPEVLIQNTRGLSDEEIESIQSSISSLAAERKGTPMLFELIEVAKENLTKVNTPSCQCAICLYGFAESDILIKTECFHYFHSHCLARYVLHIQESSKEMENASSHKHNRAEAPKVVCPVCRLPLLFSPGNENYPPPAESEKDKIEISAEVRALQRRLQRLYNIQKKKGGIIDIEAEKNKYLLEISNMPDIVSIVENTTTSETINSTATSVPTEDGNSKEIEASARNRTKGEAEISDDGRELNRLKSNYRNPYNRCHRSRNSRQSASAFGSEKGERKFLQRKEETNFTNGTLNNSSECESSSSLSRDDGEFDRDALNNSLERKNRFKVCNDISKEREKFYSVRKHSSVRTDKEVANDFKSASNRNDCKPQRYRDKRNNSKEVYGSSSYRKGNQSRRFNNRGDREYHRQKFRNDAYHFGRERRNSPSEWRKSSNDENSKVNQNNEKTGGETSRRSSAENNVKIDRRPVGAQRENSTKTYRSTKGCYYTNKRNENRNNLRKDVNCNSEECRSFRRDSDRSEDVRALANRDRNVDARS